MKSKPVLQLMILLGSIFIILLPERLSAQHLATDDAMIQQLVENQLNEDVPGILLGIQFAGFEGKQFAAGINDLATASPLLPGQSFRIASVTKTFVAAAILRLYEEGRLGLHDPITQYISKKHLKLLRKGGHQPENITIRQLLQHNAGLGDHSHTEAYNIENLRSGAVWTRERQLQALATHTKPLGIPGEKFSYSDTGYILLGEILEKVTGLTMGDAINQLIDFKKLGLLSTEMEAPEGDFSGKRIHQYFQGEDTYHYHPSLDYFGGGGLLSTTADLCRFMLALFNNEIFHKASTLALMTEAVSYTELPAMDYRMGIWKTQIGGLEAWTHTGFWGTQTAYFPELNLSITVNYSSRWKVKGNAPLLEELVKNLQSQQVQH